MSKTFYEYIIMSKTFCGYIDCFDKTLLVLSETGGSVSMVSFAIAIEVPVGKTCKSLSLVFSIGNRTAKNILKTMSKEKKNIILFP